MNFCQDQGIQNPRVTIRFLVLRMGLGHCPLYLLTWIFREQAMCFFLVSWGVSARGYHWRILDLVRSSDLWTLLEVDSKGCGIGAQASYAYLWLIGRSTWLTPQVVSEMVPNHPNIPMVRCPNDVKDTKQMYLTCLAMLDDVESDWFTIKHPPAIELVNSSEFLWSMFHSKTNLFVHCHIWLAKAPW